MQGDTRMTLEPALYRWTLGSAGVVDDQVKVEMCGRFPIDLS
jgi:hypothetical protein